MYRVLWIDDQYKDAEMIQFAIEADNSGLLLEGYASFEEGFEVIERNLELFDLILLDGLFFEKKGQVAGTEDESGIGMAIAKINELKNKKVFPWFVLSGKDKFTKGENSLLKANKAKCFDKTKPYDVVKLFEEMKLAACQQPEAQLKHLYFDLLETCSDELLGHENFSRVFALVKHIENIDKLSNSEDKLNPIRKIIERMFSRMAEKGIIPEAIITNKGWINGSSLFLSKKHSDYEYLADIIPPIISENIHRLLNIIQDASHIDGELKLKVDLYLKTAKSDYLYRSCVYLMFDLLLWFNDYIKNNSNINTNKERWRSKINNSDWVNGAVIRIAENGWGTFQPETSHKTISIPPKMISDNNLKEHDLIKIKAEPSQDGLRIHIKEIKII